MKTEKVDFKNIKDVLSRGEMKSIKGGTAFCTAGLCLEYCFQHWYQAAEYSATYPWGTCSVFECPGAPMK